MDQSLATPPQGRPRHAQTQPPRLAGLADQLLFPKLLRAGSVAARPERLVAAFLGLIVILGAGAYLNGDPETVGPLGLTIQSAELATTGVFVDIAGLDMPRLADRARQLLLESPKAALTEAPVSSLLFVVIAACAWGIFGLFISRGAAMELGRHIHIRPGRCFRFLGIKGFAAVASLLFTPIIAALLLLVPALLGLLLAVPGLDVVGGLLYGIGVAASALSALLLIVWLAAVWLAIPAVACDGADVFDATQRAIGMLLSKPLSILFHTVIVVIQGLVLVGLIWVVADLAVGFSTFAAGAFSERAKAIVVDAPGEGSFAAGLVRVWRVVPWFIAASYAVSYAHTASVAVYLNARKMVDGQEPSELWMPGDAAGVVEINSVEAE